MAYDLVSSMVNIALQQLGSVDFGPCRPRPTSVSAQLFQTINIKIVAHTIMPMGRDRPGYHKYMLISAHIALKCYL